MKLNKSNVAKLHVLNLPYIILTLDIKAYLSAFSRNFNL